MPITTVPYTHYWSLVDVFFAAPTKILGYAANLDQIFFADIVLGSGGDTYCTKWNVTTRTNGTTVHHSGLIAVINAPSADFAVDEDGNIYGNYNTYQLGKYDSNFVHIADVAWPTPFSFPWFIRLSGVGASRKVYTISDRVGQGFIGCDASGAGLSIIGKAAFSSTPDNGKLRSAMTLETSTGHERVWASGTTNNASNTASALLLMVDPAGGVSGITGFYNTTATYTLSGAVFGTPIAMWYSPTDASLVFFTAKGFLIKVAISAPTVITANVDMSPQVGASPPTYLTNGMMQEVSRFGADSAGRIWVPGPDSHTWFFYSLATLANVGSVDVRVSDSGGVSPEPDYLTSFGIPEWERAYLPDANAIVGPIDTGTGGDSSAWDICLPAPVAFTNYTAGAFADGPTLLFGYAANLGQIFLDNEGSGNHFLSKWNTTTHSLDLNHLAAPSGFPNSLKPSAFTVDEDGQLYGSNGNSAIKYGAIVGVSNAVAVSGTYTLTSVNSYVAGDKVFLSGFTGGFTGLNGSTQTVISSGLSSTQFEFTTGGSTIGGAAQTAYAWPVHTVVNVWPLFEQDYYTRLHTVGGTRYMYGLSDTQVVGLDGTGTGLTLIGRATFAASINSASHFGIQVDSSDRVWAFGCDGSFTNNGNATLLMIDPAGGVTGSSYNTTATYDVYLKRVCTNAVAAGGVYTITCTNNFAVGDKVFLTGFTGGFTGLNNTTQTVIASGLSSSQFKFNFGGSTIGSAAQSASAAQTNLGQPMAMFYCVADNSLVFFTALGFLVKWDIATTSVVGVSITLNPVVNNERQIQCASRFAPDQHGNVWLPGSNATPSAGRSSVRLYNLETLLFVTSYNTLSFGELGWDSSAYAYLPDAKYLVSGRDTPPFSNFFWDFLGPATTRKGRGVMVIT